VEFRGGVGQEGQRQGSPRRSSDGGAAGSGRRGGVTPVVIDEGGCVLQLEGDSGVRRRWSIEGKSSSEGVLTGGGRTIVTLGRSLARRRGSSGGNPVSGCLGDGDECAALGRGRTR
jgi:hypothetical protein